MPGLGCGGQRLVGLHGNPDGALVVEGIGRGAPRDAGRRLEQDALDAPRRRRRFRFRRRGRSLVVVGRVVPGKVHPGNGA